MALEEQKREDLLRDAVAYRRRIQLYLHPETSENALAPSERNGGSQEFFAGIRADGSWSLYFGEDPVFQFTPAGALRRLHVDHRMYRCVDGNLLEITRKQRGGRVELLHFPVSEDAERALRGQCLKLRQQALGLLEAGNFTQLGQVPTDDPKLMDDLLNFLAQRDC